MIASATSLFAGWLYADVAREVCGDPPDLRLAGSIRPQGQAHPVDGGYWIKGQWDFASGISHANWLLAPCLIMNGEQPRQTPAGLPEG